VSEPRTTIMRTTIDQLMASGLAPRTWEREDGEIERARRSVEETSAKRLHAWGLIYTWIYTSTHPRPKPQPTRKVGNTWLFKARKS